MSNQIKLFGPAHLLILISVLVVATGLSAWCRRSLRSASAIRYGLGTFLAINELVWYAYLFHEGGFHPPADLPLELCNVTLWVTVIAVLSLNEFAFEVVYFAGLGGSGMALLTPDLWMPLCSYPSLYFFLAHGMAVATVLTMVWGKLARPRPGSLWRVFFVMNGYAVAIAIFDGIFKTNYMYLCEKPAAASLLDYFGPWPIYIITGEAAALAIFGMLWFPFRHKTQEGPPAS